MFLTSEILASLASRYVAESTRAGREYRLVMPGLTPAIGEAVHCILRDSGINSYLVIGSSRQADEDKRWLLPVSLTSMRIGSLAAVCDPGALADVRDSIRGSGGTIRSDAFSEEWPWIEDCSESFRFAGPFVTALLDHWGIDKGDRTWFRQLISDVLVKATRRMRDRAELLLERILGEFDPSEPVSFHSKRERFLFHCGIPNPDDTSVEPSRIASRIRSKLLEPVFDRVRSEADVREQVRSNIAQDDPDRDQLLLAVERFFDGIAGAAASDADVLSFRECWGTGSEAEENWGLLTLDRLCQLFEIQDKAPVDLSVAFEQGRSALVSDDGTKAALSAEEEALLQIEYALPLEEVRRARCHLEISIRNSRIADHVLTGAKALVTESIPSLKTLGLSYRSRVPIRVAIVIGDDVRAEARVHLYCCGEKRRAFVVTTPQFWVDDAREVSEDDADPEQRHTVDGPVQLHVFSYFLEQPKVVCDDAEEQLLEDNGFWSMAEPLDPFGEAGGQVSCRCDVGGHWLSITYEAGDKERGEYTLEDELRQSIVSGATDRVREIVSIYSGVSRTPYPRLGKVTDRTRQLARMAACYENQQGWQPLLLDLRDDLEGAIRACGDYCRTWGDILSVEAIAAAHLPDQPLELLREYSQARNAVREAIICSLDTSSRSSEHPEYALYPVYIASGAEQGLALRTALRRYLEAYCSVLSYQNDHLSELSWEHAFVLTYLDCAVDWGAAQTKNNIFLLGPWHPLVAAKRYMVQRALVLRGQRLVENSDKQFARLANLLSSVTGFAWHPSLKAEDVAFEATHVVPTSDPGWHLAFKRKAADEGATLGVVMEQIYDKFGLECSVNASASGAMIDKVMSSFLRTFPSRRHVGIYLPRGFQGCHETASIDRLLHQDDEPTCAGHQLTGGIALCFQDEPDLPQDTTWADPALQIFRYPDWEKCALERYPDIRFCQPASGLRFLEANGEVALPRGRGLDAVFGLPLSRCIQGQTFIPQSVREGWDLPEETHDAIGTLFVRACSMASITSKQHFGLVESIALPEHLKSSWTVVPGSVLDPAVFVRYVEDGRSRDIEERALWDYRVSLSSGTSSFFVLSTIPMSYRSAVNGVFGDEEDHASTFVSELGRVGLAIAGEAMKSGRHALGTIGLVGAVRLFGGHGQDAGPIQWSPNHVGFLLPVDSFEDFLENKTDRPRGEGVMSRRRADLLAVSVSVPDDDSQPLIIQALSIECKFCSGTYPLSNVNDALAQAQVTTEWFQEVCTIAAQDAGMAERLGLLQMLWFGTRISGDGCDNRTELERRLYEAVLSGRFQFRPAGRPAVLVTTEMALSGSAEMTFLQHGAWFRLNRQNWPGIHNTNSVEAIRSAVRDLFDHALHPVTTPGSEAASDAASSLAPVSGTPDDDKEKKEAAEDVREHEPSTVPNGDRPAPSPVQPAGDAQDEQVSWEGDEVISCADLPLGIAVQRILVGVDSARREVYFDPHSPVDRLDNVNAMITGSSGKGKTQLLKYVLTAFRDQGANALVLDFKNDFASDIHFVERAGLESVLVALDGLPFNPLIPYPITDPRNGQAFVQSAQHITGLASVLRRTYGLGAQQEAAVKNAIRQAFSEAGVDPRNTVTHDPGVTFPDLARVGEILEQESPSAYNRLDPLFTLGLFREESCRSSFARMVARSIVMDLSQIPSDPLKNALAELIVLSAHSYYNSEAHCGALRQVLAVDEAHRILQADFIERFALECRAYGVSLLLSSQYPSHFPADVRDCMATKIIHGNDRDIDRVKEIVNLLDCRGGESEVAELGMFEAMYSNKHFRNTCIRTITYPVDLVLSALKESEGGELSREEIAQIPGLDTDKLSVGNIVRHLERLGLAEGTNGSVRLLSRSS